jgi:hypothetical protein
MNADPIHPDASDTRFSMRSLLVVMTCVAVIAAAGGVVLRAMPAPTRPRVLIFWGATAALVSIGIAFQFYRRRRAEQQAGHTLLRVPIDGRRRSSYLVARPLLTAFNALAMIGLFTFIVAKQQNGLSVVEVLLPMSFGIVAFSFIAPSLLWSRDVRFCERGILYNQAVLHWDHVADHKWTDFGGKLELHSVDGENNRPWLKISVAPENWTALEELIVAKTNETCLFEGSRQVSIGQVPISNVWKTSYLIPHLWAVAASALCGSVLFWLGFIRGVGVGEWASATERSYFVLFILFSFPFLRQWSYRNSGVTLSRLFARRGWFGFVSAVGAALSLYFLASRVGFPAGWMTFIAGIAFMLLTLLTFTYFFTTQLDLRTNGVVLAGAFFARGRR